MIYAAMKTTRTFSLKFQNQKGSPEIFLQSISNNNRIPETSEEVTLHCAKVIVIFVSAKDADKISYIAAALIASSPLKVLLSNKCTALPTPYGATRRADLHRGIVELKIMYS
jgi:hypothetical protein